MKRNATVDDLSTLQSSKAPLRTPGIQAYRFPVINHSRNRLSDPINTGSRSGIYLMSTDINTLFLNHLKTAV
jgi:hypothetical protein